MSREFQAAVSGYHDANADRWRNLPNSQRYVEVRVDGSVFYVYLHEIDAAGEDLHIQTQIASVPERWLDCWPTNDGTIRRYLHQQLDLGGTRITTLEA